MATPERKENPGLSPEAAALEEARRIGFYPLVQLLERLSGGAPPGTAAAPWEERIRFRHDPSLAFSTADVVEVREVTSPPSDADPESGPVRAYEVITSFLGLTGGVSPLPSYLAEEVAQEDPEAPRLRQFLDLFHHRLISFLYRARARCDMPGGWRRDLRDAWSARLMALLGIDLAATGTAGPLPAWRLLRLAPLLAEREVTAHALEVAIADALEPSLGKVGVSVELFAGAWTEIPDDQRVRLGRTASLLGRDLVVGQRVFDAAGRFRVVIGPLGAGSYRRFVDEQLLRLVEALLGGLVAEHLEREVHLWLAEDAAPSLQLGSSRLGRTSWLGGQRRRTRIRAESAA